VVKNIPTEGASHGFRDLDNGPEIITKIKKARPGADDKFLTYYPR